MKQGGRFDSPANEMQILMGPHIQICTLAYHDACYSRRSILKTQYVEMRSCALEKDDLDRPYKEGEYACHGLF